ncbi:kappaPI-actitoxin-Ael3a-like [Haemaphysalis longicornis]
MSAMLRRTALLALLVTIGLSGTSAQRKPSLCYLPKDSGVCYAFFPSFYYDSATRTCRRFIYGGCMGNENRFTSFEECTSVCG